MPVPIAQQTSLPVAQFIQEPAAHASLPVAVPVKVVDAQAQAFAAITDGSAAQPPVKKNWNATIILLVILLICLGGAGYAIYHFLIAPNANGAAADSTKQLPVANGGRFTRSPTAPTAPTTRTPTVVKAPTPPTPEVYGIEFVYSPTPIPTPIVNVFEQAKARWQTILVEPGVSPRPPLGSKLCDHNERIYNGIETIDDLEVWVEILPIDGPGKILGYAGPCGLVVGNTFRSVTGEMVFDLDDMNALLADGSLLDVVTHELGHVLGIGSWWEAAGLAVSPSYTYTGANGIAGHAQVGGPQGVPPPVELDGGQGTAGSHWDDTTFGNELMTGYVSSSGNPLSKLSVLALVDLGYTVRSENGESYSKPLGRRLRGKDDNDDDNKKRKRRRMYKDTSREHKKKAYPIVRIFDDEE